jgi:hypothetical protein
MVYLLCKMKTKRHFPRMTLCIIYLNFHTVIGLSTDANAWPLRSRSKLKASNLSLTLHFTILILILQTLSSLFILSMVDEYLYNLATINFHSISCNFIQQRPMTR